MRDPEDGIRAEQVPAPVRALLERLEEHGYESVLVGGCVRDLLLGRPPTDFDVATAAAPEVVLRLFERAIPTGLRHGTVTVPTPAGPVDVTTFRAGPHCEDDLARRDFTLNAMAWRAREGKLIDPFGGLADLRERRLRAVGDARQRLREDPLRALRAARMAAAFGLQVDPELEHALGEARGALAGVARERIRRELEALMQAPHPDLGLELLRRTGLEGEIAPGVREDASRVVAALPADGVLRLAAWLRGTDAAAILSRLRFPKQTAETVGRLVRLHPVERQANPEHPAEVRRLLRRAGEEGMMRLLELREAELRAGGGDQDARDALARLRAAVERVKRSGVLALRRSDLAIDGREVMQLLGCGPGPEVGRALRYLTERVIEDPGLNSPESLRELLLRHAAPGRSAAAQNRKEDA